jgi:dihydrofolate reductase
MLGGATPAPHLAWWDSTDDGRLYRGWEDSLELLRRLAERDSPVGLLGFSQGAIVAAALTALAESGAFPALRFAVLVAGRKPRAELLQPLFTRPLLTPSLHVWGERDAFGQTESAKLVTHFDASRREVASWPGPHLVPTHGPGADAIVDFIVRHAGG